MRNNERVERAKWTEVAMSLMAAYVAAEDGLLVSHQNPAPPEAPPAPPDLPDPAGFEFVDLTIERLELDRVGG